MKKTLLGLGSAAMDTVISCPSLAGSDSFQIVKKELLLPGGSCANMLAAFAALGGTSRLAAKIGDDGFGCRFRESLVKDGVDDSLLFIKKGGTTLHTFVVAADDGEHCIFLNLGDSLMELAAEELPATVLEDVDLFYADLFPAQAAAAVAGQCRAKGIPVIIGLECAPSLMESAGVSREDIYAALALADLVVGGRDVYCELMQTGNYREAVELLYRRFRPALGAVCTAGAQGSLWLDATGPVSTGVYNVVPLDSTGAGDCFLAGLLYRYFACTGERMEALRFASAMGAMKCLQFGPRMKTSPENVSAFMRTHRLGIASLHEEDA